ncbi:MAG: hypothetical protein QME51_00775 [Planctomycetota bacterium]|nr:hypothetical protein [Planctomycetota bacterium]
MAVSPDLAAHDKSGYMREQLQKDYPTNDVKMDNTGSQSAGKVVSLAEIGWLAGFVDGEGCLGFFPVSNKRMQIRTTICNTDFTTIVKCKDISARLGANGYLVIRRLNTKWKPVLHITVAGFKKNYRLLNALLPYLQGVSKKMQAMWVLSFIYSRFGRNVKRSTKLKYNDFESRCIAEALKLRKRGPNNLNDHTPERYKEIRKIWSELHRQYAEAAEMTARFYETDFKGKSLEVTD